MKPEIADVLEVALAKRPDRVAHAAFTLLDDDARKELAAQHEDLQALALAEPAAMPSAALRARLLQTVRNARKPRRALLVVDMINDHLTPGRILEVPRARDIVPALAARIAEARRDGVPIVYVLDRHNPEDSDLDDWGQHAVEGTEGAEVWPALAPHQGDHLVTKPSYSSFFRSTLESTLDSLGVDTLELTGCSTEVQLVATATDALQLGFTVEVPVTLQAGTSLQAEQSALQTLQFLVPYKPAHEARLARVTASRAAEAAGS
jgi:nicotinamidase-related amidase